MGSKQVILQRGGSDLFAFFHIAADAIRAEAKSATDDTVVVELWGNGTSSYKPVMAGYGGWAKYVASLAQATGVQRFEHTCLTTWSAGSEIIKTVCRGAVLPDAIVSCDGLYGTKPVGARPGDGNVIFDAEFQAVAQYALAAARGEKVFVLMHSSISTPYGSSGECAMMIRRWVEDTLGKEMQPDETISPSELNGHVFSDALVLGGFHLLEFPGIDGKEHMVEGHLFDELWRRFIPWASGPSVPAPAMTLAPPSSLPRTLRVGLSGEDVRAWQNFLRGQGHLDVVADGIFGNGTATATQRWQAAHGIVADGLVGQESRTAASAENGAVEEPPVPLIETIPGPPPFPPLVGTMARAAVFGSFHYVPAPVPGNPEAVRIDDGWDRRNIVQVHLPQLAGVPGAPQSCSVSFHRLAQAKLQELFAAWEAAGLMSHVETWDGSWAPRFIRGSRVTLSNHAYGSAFDVNARFNPLGTKPHLGRGTTVPLVEIANSLGWFWGGHFSTRPDPMHFEIAQL